MFMYFMIGALLARMYGGLFSIPKSKIVLGILCILPFVYSCFYVSSYIGILSILGIVGILTGHGMYLSTTMKKLKPEKVDFIVRLVFGEDPRISGKKLKNLYNRNSFGMFVTGTLVGLPACLICLSTSDYVQALLFACTGLVKAFAYRVTKNTEISEFLNGGLRTIICYYVIHITI